ncbi:hypothetical protein HanXRQr2_Chr08g0328631 [Helianthus annuus]|uniref:Uncharacterized protein n=1 Tax=Helianthus annuus TaxID=4232 RepID=A0A9K3ICZ7_HELAN|nr:hypothetical protein HanXRQr2_Chr08g0328631 [Helianthus annuus]KAJ0900784.1 hypothetical protein HanPSC8_Chr08g0317681 [Helianthus annuus]
MPQNNFNQSQVGPPMVFAGLPQGVAMSNQLQMECNNSTVRPFVAIANGESSKKINQGDGFSNRGGRKPFQRGGDRFRGGISGPRSGSGIKMGRASVEDGDANVEIVRSNVLLMVPTSSDRRL